MRRARELPAHDFSLSQLGAGIVQVVALAALFLAYLSRDKPSLPPILLVVLVLQTLTLARLLWRRQR